MAALHRNWIFLGIALLSVIFGVVNETNSLILWSLLAVFISIGAIQILDTKHSILVVLAFISFQGFFKVVSNYNPIIHLGADIVVIALILKFILLQFFSKIKTEIPLPPLYLLFAIHFGWVFICLFNPYSVGFIPSVAGAKIYVSMFLLYFFGYYLTRSLKDVHLYFRVFIVLTVIHTLFAFAQGFIGAASVLWLHPRYGVQMAKYAGQAFRPFGLTHVPGAPSVFIYTALPFFMYFILLSRSFLERFFLMAFLPIIGQTLLFCQVRSSILKGLVGMAGFVLLFFTSRYKMPVHKKVYAFSLIGLGTLVTIVSIPYLMSKSIESLDTNEDAFERSMSTFDYDAMSKARKNTGERFLAYAKEVPFGAGLSRVGASAGAFKSAVKADTFFPQGYFFADNLFITTVIELGIPGLFFLTLLLVLILAKGFANWRKETRQPLIGAQLAILAALFSIFIGSYGSEGIIYNPESAFFWFFSGVLMSMGRPDFQEQIS